MGKLSRTDSRENKSFLTETLSLTVSAVIVKLLGVIYKIPLSAFLGDEGMGYFNSAYTVYGFFYILCTAGVPKAIMLIMTEAKAGKTKSTEQRILSVSLSAFLILGTAVTLLFILLAQPLAILIGNRESFATMISIAPSVIFISLAGVIRGSLSADLKFSAVAVSQIIEGAGKLIIGLAFAAWATYLSLPLPIVSALTILGVTFGSLFGMIHLAICQKISNKGVKQPQTATPRERRTILKKVFSISIPITASAAVMSITGIVDLALIMRRLEALGQSEASASAMYGNYTTMAVPMFNLVIAVASPIAVAFLPLMKRAHISGKASDFYSTLKDALSFAFFISVPLTFGMWLYSEEVLALIFRGMDVHLGSTLLRALIPGLAFMIPLLVINSALEARGRIYAPILSMAVASVAKLAVSYWMIGREEYGILGAPIGTVISYALALTASIIMLHREGIAAPLFSAIRPVLNSIISIIPVYLAFPTLCGLAGEIPGLLVSILISAILYLIISVLGGDVKKIRAMKWQTTQI